MMFDRLATLVDRHLPAARPFLHDARLFDFPYKAHEVVPKEYPLEQRAFLAEHFFLPFHAVAIEDKASTLVLVDTEAEQKGLAGRRYFIEYLPSADLDPTAWRPEEQELIRASMAAKNPLPLDSGNVASGYIEHVQFTPEGQWMCKGEIATSFLATPDRVLLSMHKERKQTQEYLASPDVARHLRGEARAKQEEAMRAATLRNVMVAMQEVMLLNTPERFIVEVATPEAVLAEQRGQAKKRRTRDPKARAILHSDERPIYVLLTPHEIRERFHFPVPAGGIKTAHERRRHLRTYPDDPARWPKAHGKVIVVPSVWVGPSEVRVEKRRYRVMVDL